MITQERLKELLSYDPETGVFTWKVSLNWRIKIGTVAGGINDGGYRRIQIERIKYGAHRLAWLYVYGYIPVKEIDHRDGNTDNNKINNLRVAKHAENGQNRKLGKNNTSGYLGVYWFKHQKKWCSLIVIDGKTVFLGYFNNKKDASNAYLSAKKKFHTFNPIPREM